MEEAHTENLGRIIPEARREEGGRELDHARMLVE
jgi:hypothetical protein